MTTDVRLEERGEGSGVGLAERYGGSVELDEAEAGGPVITVSLPTAHLIDRHC